MQQLLPQETGGTWHFFSLIGKFESNEGFVALQACSAISTTGGHWACPVGTSSPLFPCGLQLGTVICSDSLSHGQTRSHWSFSLCGIVNCSPPIWTLLIGKSWNRQNFYFQLLIQEKKKPTQDTIIIKYNFLL